MTMRSAKEKMLAGELYRADDPELVADVVAASRWMQRYDAALPLAPADRMTLLREMLGTVGTGVNIRPPFRIDYGYNIHVGDDVFVNFGCVILDVCAVRIGNGTQIGPNVQILAADHPRDPDDRERMLELGRPVTIGRNVWIGGGAILLPGVTIGDHAIVGAGAVVTRDVAAHATVVGNPARPLTRRT